MNCLINLATLTSAPYSLTQGNQVIARVIATNIIGDSTPSTLSVSSAAIVALPSKPLPPTWSDASDLNSITLNIIPLQGTALGGLLLDSYSVYWDSGSGTTPTTLYNSTTQLFELFPCTTSTTYKFAIAGKNELGEGQVSDTFSLVCATKPQIPTAPTTSIQGTNVLISWTAPDNGGSTILSYRVQVKDALGNYQNLVLAQATTSITLPISNYTSEPFNLMQGYLVSAKVSASNSIGEGPVSLANSDGALIIVKPH